MGLAAETTGIMETLNRATFEYLRTRKQFGTTLSGFQALRHRAADMFAAAEQAAHLCHRGLNAMERGEPGVSALASAMKALRSDEHTSELQSLTRTPHAVFCLKKKTNYPH